VKRSLSVFGNTGQIPGKKKKEKPLVQPTQSGKGGKKKRSGDWGRRKGQAAFCKEKQKREKEQIPPTPKTPQKQTPLKKRIYEPLCSP